MAYVRGGDFDVVKERFGQLPAERVHVDAFFVDVLEVSTAEYRACVASKACRAPTTFEGVWKKNFCNYVASDHEDHPINCVTWHDAHSYCAWRKKRLPSDREWQLAAVGGTRRYPWGDDDPTDQPCWLLTDQGTCARRSHPRDVTPDGIFDLAGNVAEWTSTTTPKCQRDSGPCKDGRVDCGGNWALNSPLPQHRPKDLLVSRQGDDGAVRDPRMGFRCATSSP
jgi:formylglycine-generating enzyme required for sulfatase activity